MGLVWGNIIGPERLSQMLIASDYEIQILVFLNFGGAAFFAFITHFNKWVGSILGSFGIIALGLRFLNVGLGSMPVLAQYANDLGMLLGNGMAMVFLPIMILVGTIGLMFFVF